MPKHLQPDSYFSDESFPPVEQASREGLLAIGGDLSTARLLQAYHQGIFPWYNEGQPVLWWSPDPRTVIEPTAVKISRSLRKTITRGEYHVTFDGAFEQVIASCADPSVRRAKDSKLDTTGTWITSPMQQAYCDLHRAGYAHSVECWRDSELVGGLYGVSLGAMFFGESMFSRARDASKVAFVYLCAQLSAWNFDLVDCQLPSDHLFRLGAMEISRREFITLLQQSLQSETRTGVWQPDVQITKFLTNNS